MKILRFLAIAVIAIVLLALAAWSSCEWYHARMSDPANRAHTYTEYRHLLPTPYRAQVWHIDSADYYVTFGPIKAPLAFTSGPPAYVFNSKGEMIDWSYDLGDDPRFSKKWQWQKPEKRDIPVADLDVILKRNFDGNH